MPSDRQVRANQMNALKSTGPKTEAGKAASSANALRHGLTARQIVLSGENPAEFETLREDLAREIAPITAMEVLLVDRLAQLFWRLRRVPTFEAALLTWSEACDHKHHKATAVTLGGVFISCEQTRGNEKWLAAEVRQERHARERSGRSLAALFLDGDVLNKLGRYERELMRQLERTLDTLTKGRRLTGFGQFIGRRVRSSL